MVSMPLARSSMAAKPRSHFACAGESSTHETSYTGVEPVQLASLPVESGATKAKLLGLGVATAPAPKLRHFDTTIGLPICWQERKSIALWKAVL